jgi:hypothetical protein
MVGDYTVPAGWLYDRTSAHFSRLTCKRTACLTTKFVNRAIKFFRWLLFILIIGEIVGITGEELSQPDQPRWSFLLQSCSATALHFSIAFLLWHQPNRVQRKSN